MVGESTKYDSHVSNWWRQIDMFLYNFLDRLNKIIWISLERYQWPRTILVYNARINLTTYRQNTCAALSRPVLTTQRSFKRPPLFWYQLSTDRQSTHSSTRAALSNKIKFTTNSPSPPHPNGTMGGNILNY